MKLTFKIVDDLRCPKCGHGEMHPNGEWCLIRAFKVEMGDGHWWSQCLVCAGYYNPETLEVNPPSGQKDQFGREIPQGFDSEKGWF